jgi:hypothetical protein
MSWEQGHAHLTEVRRSEARRQEGLSLFATWISASEWLLASLGKQFRCIDFIQLYDTFMPRCEKAVYISFSILMSWVAIWITLRLKPRA